VEPERLCFERAGEPLGGLLLRGPARTAPGVVLVPSVHGCNDYVIDVARRLVSQRYNVFVFDLYSRGDKPGDLSSPELIGAAVAGLPDERIALDVAAAGRYLGAHEAVAGEPVAALGFCVGGLYSFLAAAVDGTFAAAVDFYGMIRYRDLSGAKRRQPVDSAEAINAPLLAHFGEGDPWCSGDHVEELKRRLATAGKVHEIYTYPGAGHAFHEFHRPAVYRPVAAAAAWDRSLVFLDYYLHGSHA